MNKSQGTHTVAAGGKPILIVEPHPALPQACWHARQFCHTLTGDTPRVYAAAACARVRVAGAGAPWRRGWTQHPPYRGRRSARVDVACPVSRPRPQSPTPCLPAGRAISMNQTTIANTLRHQARWEAALSMTRAIATCPSERLAPWLSQTVKGGPCRGPIGYQPVGWLPPSFWRPPLAAWDQGLLTHPQRTL